MTQEQSQNPDPNLLAKFPGLATAQETDPNAIANAANINRALAQQISVPEPYAPGRERLGGQADYLHPLPPLDDDTPFPKNEEYSDMGVPLQARKFKRVPVINPQNWIAATRFVNYRVDVGATTPLEIVNAMLPDDQGFGRKSITLYNNSGVILWIASDINMASVSSGFPIQAGGTFTLDNDSTGSIFALAASGTVDCRIWIENGYMAPRLAGYVNDYLNGRTPVRDNID